MSKKEFSLFSPSTWFNRGLQAPDLSTGDLSTKKHKNAGLGGKLSQATEFESKLEIAEFNSNVELAEHLTSPDRRPLNYHYKQALKDAHLSTQVSTRKNKILSEPFGLYNEAGKLDEKATRLLKKPWFDKFIKYAIDAKLWGFSVIELEGLTSTGHISGVKMIPRNNVDQVNGVIHLRSESWEGNGYPFREGPLVKNLIEISEGPRDLGILLNCVKWVIYKNYSVSDWSRHSEKFGMPAIALKTDTTDKNNLDKKEAFLSSFGANAYTILDLDDELSLIEAAKNDPFNIYDKMIDRADAQISKQILGQTGTTEEKAFVGSAEVHERVLEDYTLADIRSLVYDINYKLIPRLILKGYPLKGLYFDYEINRKEEKAPKSTTPKKREPEEEDEDEKKLSLSPDLERLLRTSLYYQDPHKH